MCGRPAGWRGWLRRADLSVLRDPTRVVVRLIRHSVVPMSATCRLHRGTRCNTRDWPMTPGCWSPLPRSRVARSLPPGPRRPGPSTAPGCWTRMPLTPWSSLSFLTSSSSWARSPAVASMRCSILHPATATSGRGTAATHRAPRAPMSRTRTGARARAVMSARARPVRRRRGRHQPWCGGAGRPRVYGHR